MGITNRRKMKLRKQRNKKVAKPNRLSPMQVVKRDFGSKKELAAKVIPLIERPETETAEEFTKRIETLSNTKLLKLLKVGTEMKEHGTKAELADKVYKKIRGDKNKVDQDYLNKLNSFSMGKLIDMNKFYKRNK